MSVWISDEKLLIFASLISPSKTILFEKKYQTFDTVFHHQMKHLEVRQKYSAARRIFNSLLGVSSSDETLRLMFDILHKLRRSCNTAAVSGLSRTKCRFLVMMFFTCTLEGWYVNTPKWWYLVFQQVSRLARKCVPHGGRGITRSRSEKKDDSFLTSGVRECINKIWVSVGL